MFVSVYPIDQVPEEKGYLTKLYHDIDSIFCFWREGESRFCFCARGKPHELTTAQIDTTRLIAVLESRVLEENWLAVNGMSLDPKCIKSLIVSRRELIIVTKLRDFEINAGDNTGKVTEEEQAKLVEMLTGLKYPSHQGDC